MNPEEHDDQLDKLFSEVPRVKTPEYVTGRILESIHMESRRRSVSTLKRPEKERPRFFSFFLSSRLLHYAEAAAVFLIIILGLSIIQDRNSPLNNMLITMLGIDGQTSVSVSERETMEAATLGMGDNRKGDDADIQMRSAMAELVDAARDNGQLFPAKSTGMPDPIATPVSTSSRSGISSPSQRESRLVVFKQNQQLPQINEDDLIDVIRDSISPEGPVLVEPYASILKATTEQVERENGIVKSWTMLRPRNGEGPNILKLTCMSPVSKTTVLKRVFSADNILVPDQGIKDEVQPLNPFHSKLVMASEISDREDSRDASVRQQSPSTRTVSAQVSEFEHTIDFSEFNLYLWPSNLKVVDPNNPSE